MACGLSSFSSRALEHILSSCGPPAQLHVGSSWIRDWTHVSCIGRQILYHWATRKVLLFIFKVFNAYLRSNHANTCSLWDLYLLFVDSLDSYSDSGSLLLWSLIRDNNISLTKISKNPEDLNVIWSGLMQQWGLVFTLWIE